MKAPCFPIFRVLSCALFWLAFSNHGNAATSFEFPITNPPANKYWSSGEGAPFGNKLKITVEEGEVLAVTANEIIINRRKAKIKIEALCIDGWKYYFDKDSPLKEGTHTLDFSKEGVKKELAICTFYQDHDDSEEGNEKDKKVERIHAYLRVADLSVDSLNNHPYGGNDRSDDADLGENPTSGGAQTGKIIITNLQANTEESTDKPGWADFTGASNKETNFAHMDLFLQAFPEGTLVRFVYSGSNPAEVKKEEDGTWFLPEGHMRIWTKHGNQTRKPKSFTEGDYIPPNTEFSLEKLKSVDQGDGHYLFFVESVRGSAKTADQTIKVQVKLPGGDWINLDTVGFTLFPVQPVAPVVYMISGHDGDIVELKTADFPDVTYEWKLVVPPGTSASATVEGKFQNTGETNWSDKGTKATVKFRPGKDGAGDVAGHSRKQTPGKGILQLSINGKLYWKKSLEVLEIKTRGSWGAVAPDLTKLEGMPGISGITFHHSSNTGDGATEVLRIQKLHMSLFPYWLSGRGYGDIGYHFLMAKNGDIYAGRPLEGLTLTGGSYTKGSHVENNNTAAGIGICMLGDYEGTEPFPLSRQKDLEKILTALCRRYGLNETKVSYHKDRATTNPTECPGSNVIPKSPDIIKHVKDNLK